MQRVGFQLHVAPEHLDEYRARHSAIWPDMADALRRQGWHNYSLFVRPDGLLFGYVECEESFAASLEGMAGEEVNTRWQAWMAELFADNDGTPADQMMVELDEVFHIE